MVLSDDLSLETRVCVQRLVDLLNVLLENIDFFKT